MARPAQLAAALMAVVSLGCGFGKPHQANVKLRKENETLQQQVTQLEREAQQLRSDVRRLESESDVLPTLPQERLEQLWTVGDIRFGRLTGIDRRAEGSPLKVYLRPVDPEGSTMKAAGSITIEAFDLESEQVRLGRWEFPIEEARKHWMSVGVLNEYVLTCPWQSEAPAEGRNILVRAIFQDALTQRSFQSQVNVK